MSSLTMIDPPSGWKYGWPKPLPEHWKSEEFDLRQWFLDNGYPEKDIDLALRYSRQWTVENKYDLNEAIEVCESFGFRVIDKTRINKLSYYMIVTDMEERDYYGENFKEIHNEEAEKYILNEVKNIIKYSENKTDEYFLKNATKKDWTLTVIV